VHFPQYVRAAFLESHESDSTRRRLCSRMGWIRARCAARLERRNRETKTPARPGLEIKTPGPKWKRPWGKCLKV